MNGLGAPAMPDLTLTVSPFSSAVVAIGHDDLMSSPKRRSLESLKGRDWRLQAKNRRCRSLAISPEQ
jgi:hypothetical protein